VKPTCPRWWRPTRAALYARNVLDFLKLILPKEGGLKIDMEDDIVAACLMTQNGEVRRK
jgi:NAD(P) transhydrogenase subunit alpha